ncbi:hypothetical protein GCM10023186_09140 [Hymenobacter koreensis]|uniref:DUF3667 domain-containing protein n=2 Tax=Hymenobacter koreensis TaxID=1084523 RepID=A0ABP8IVN3_9BACT
MQLFLITNLLFYLVAGFTHFSPFQTKLQYHLGSGFGGFAQRLLDKRLAQATLSLADFTTRFDTLVHVYSKSLVFLFIPMLALPLWLLFRRQRRYFVEWLTLSTYMFGGILLLFGAAAVFSLTARLLPVTRPVFISNDLITGVMFALTTTYFALFMGGAFPTQPLWKRVLKATLMTAFFLVALVIPYRFVLFMVTYWSI